VFSVLLIGAGLVGPLLAAPQIELTPIAKRSRQSVAITHAGPGSGRLFITLQPCQVLIYDGQQVLPTPFLDIASLITAGGERGLLSVVFHPNYVSNGLVYVNYTDLNGDTVVSRYAVRGPKRGRPGSAAILLNVRSRSPTTTGASSSSGGRLPLYRMGDGGSGGIL